MKRGNSKTNTNTELQT